MVEDTPAEYTKEVQDDAAKLLAFAAEMAKTAGVACDTVQVDREHVQQAIIDAAKSKGCDVTVMASHGRRGVSAIVLGSVTVKVLTHSGIPVLVHRQWVARRGSNNGSDTINRRGWLFLTVAKSLGYNNYP